MDLQKALEVGTKAREFLEILQMWGMERTHAKAIVTRMMEHLNDSKYPWKNLTMVNNEETARFLQSGMIEGMVSLNDPPEGTKQ